MDPTPSQNFRVGLYVTCAVDLIRPSVGFAAVHLLERAGCVVEVPSQSCCGQVAYNNGLPAQTRELALSVVDAFRDVDYVVVPSGSCASMLKNHYPALFDHRNEAVNHFASRVYELTCFLTAIAPLPAADVSTPSHKRVAYHDSCAGLRELDIREQPRQLIRNHGHDTLCEIPDGDTCCGFGGTFCVKFPRISDRMVTGKATNVRELEPDLLLGGDLTCLLNLAGKLQRQGEESIQVRHVAEYLAGDVHTPAIGLKP